MAAYDTLRAAIDNYIKANGNKEITGTVLNDILNAMVSALGADARFAGVAVPSTNPGNPEGNVVYFASQAGTYSNFGGIVLQLGIHILVWNGTAWTSQTWFSVNNTPTQNSQNLVTSGGIFQAIVDAVGVERLRAIGAEVTSCSFNSTTKKVSFFNSANTTLFQLDATAFIIDGMVSDVKIENGNLVIKFNTDAGKQDIEIPLTDIFNPANYYTKTTIDELLTAINNKLADGCLYRGMAEPTTNPPTPTTKVFYIATKAGTYTNFGNIAVTEGITILKYDGSNWSKEQISYSDGVFDITAYNGTSYADLAAALGTNGANIPQNLRKGGMSVKFVQSSDNKYVQYRLMANSFSTTVTDWQGVDEEPIANSKNLVESGGVAVQLVSFESGSNNINELSKVSVAYTDGYSFETQLVSASTSSRITLDHKNNNYYFKYGSNYGIECLRCFSDNGERLGRVIVGGTMMKANCYYKIPNTVKYIEYACFTSEKNDVGIYSAAQSNLYLGYNEPKCFKLPIANKYIKELYVYGQSIDNYKNQDGTLNLYLYQIHRNNNGAYIVAFTKDAPTPTGGTIVLWALFQESDKENPMVEIQEYNNSGIKAWAVIDWNELPIGVTNVASQVNGCASEIAFSPSIKVNLDYKNTVKLEPFVGYNTSKESTTSENGIFDLSGFDESHQTSGYIALGNNKYYYLKFGDIFSDGYPLFKLYDINKKEIYVCKNATSLKMKSNVMYKINTLGAAYIRYSQNNAKFDISGVFSCFVFDEVEKISNIVGNGNGRNVLWIGTSISAGCTFPEYSCKYNGLNIYKNARGASRITWNPSQIIAWYQTAGYALTATKAELEEKFRPFVERGDCTEAWLQDMKNNYSYESIVIPYINGVTASCDIVVFEHGYNDRGIIQNDLANSSLDWDTTDRATFVGAFNYLIQEIMKVNPKIKIIICGYYQNFEDPSVSTDRKGNYVCEMQEKLSEKYAFPLMKTWKYTRASFNFVPNTSSYIATLNSQYSKSYPTDWMTDQNGNITYFQLLSPDTVHPSSDPTGYSDNALNGIIVKLLRNCI